MKPKRIVNGEQKHVMSVHLDEDNRPEVINNKQGTYPEYYVESENEILDAAAHFMSLEMLP